MNWTSLLMVGIIVITCVSCIGIGAHILNATHFYSLRKAWFLTFLFIGFEIIFFILCKTFIKIPITDNLQQDLQKDCLLSISLGIIIPLGLIIYSTCKWKKDLPQYIKLFRITGKTSNQKILGELILKGQETIKNVIFIPNENALSTLTIIHNVRLVKCNLLTGIIVTPDIKKKRVL